MKQVTIDFIVEQLIAGNDPKFLAIDSIGISAMDYSGDIERGCIYNATMWQGESEKTFISFYNYNDSKLEPLTLNYTNIRTNTSIERSENELVSRLFLFIEDLDGIIPAVIEDGAKPVSDKLARIANAFTLYTERSEFEFYTAKNDRIILNAKVRHFPIIAKRFNDSYVEQGLKKHVLDWHINADLAEFSFYQDR